MKKDLYSVTEVAELLGLHVKTVRNYLRDGRLKSTRIGKQYRIARADLEKFTGAAVTGTQKLKVPRTLEVSSIVQISDINPEDASRMANILVAAAKGNDDEQPLRVESIYYEDSNRLKVIISGSVYATVALLKMLENLSGKNDGVNL